VLVVIGAPRKGKKEIIAVESGYRESAESWSSLLRQLKQRGLRSFRLAIGDGALGFWKALREVYPECKEQRCWVHKTANVLDKLPKHLQKQAKRDLHEIYNADTKERANKAFDTFVRNYQNKYPKAVECLVKDRESLLSFYDFPAIHWQHIRSTNPIESAFATVRLRSDKTRGHGTETTTLLMVYKLIEQASKRWQKLRGSNMIEFVMTGHKFINGELQIAA
jgi:transposase-like protein